MNSVVFMFLIVGIKNKDCLFEITDLLDYVSTSFSKHKNMITFF